MEPPAATGNRSRNVAWVKWGGVVVVGLALGLWTGSLQRDRAYRQGTQLTRQVSEMVVAAREARQAGQTEQAIAKLEQAVDELRTSEESVRHPVYVALLADLAALQLTRPDRPPEVIDRCDALLDEAWTLAAPEDVIVRARIARERGLVEVLRDDLAKAEHWYRLAVELNPEDRVSHQRLDLLEQAKGWDSLHE